MVPSVNMTCCAHIRKQRACKLNDTLLPHTGSTLALYSPRSPTSLVGLTQSIMTRYSQAAPPQLFWRTMSRVLPAQEAIHLPHESKTHVYRHIHNTYACNRVCMCIYIYVCVHIHKHMHIFLCTCTYTCTYTYTYTYTYRMTCACTCTLLHVYVYLCVCIGYCLHRYTVHV